MPDTPTDDTWVFQANPADAELFDPEVDDDDGADGPKSGSKKNAPGRHDRHAHPLFDYPRPYERGRVKAPTAPTLVIPPDVKRLPLTRLTRLSQRRDADMVKDPRGKTK